MSTTTNPKPSGTSALAVTGEGPTEGSPPARSPSSTGAGLPVTAPVMPPNVIDEAPLEVDVEHNGNDEAPANDNDSAFEERLSSYTASLTSSVVNYPTEHGRRYHAFRAGAYALPNDEVEMDRLDIHHVLIVKLIGNKLYMAPIEEDKTHRILDLGTGTGVWAIEMGDLFPAAEIIGNDLSAIQPSWVPPNVKFEIDDVESEWVETARFDFIFGRYFAAAILDWPKLVQNAFDHLNPGGWAEFQDYNLTYYSDDGTLTEDHWTNKWITTFPDACAKTGRELSPGPKLEGWMRAAGFTNIVHHRFKLPIGPWPKDPVKKDIGMHNLVQILDGLEGFTLRLFCSILGWTEQEVMVLLAKVRSELKANAFHATFDYHVVYGQKPEN